jgi:hypothetical protein
MGYIRYNKTFGTLEMTNFKARLEKRHLHLGETSKRDNENLAGCHGEGFKLAALVMLRTGHSFKFETNSYHWNFGFSKGSHATLRCRLTQAITESVRKKKSAFDQSKRLKGPDFQRSLISNIWEDMTVKVGKARGGQGVSISEQDFREWLKVALDLHPPRSLVRTGEGDLILDKEFSAQLYLKGLLVSGHGPDGRSYIYGYNFLRGEINRDRERLTDKSEEAAQMARLWEQSISNRDPEMTDRYIDLFLNHPQSPDVALAEDHVSESTAQEIWKTLRSLHPDAFFHGAEKEKGEPSTTTDVSSLLHYLRTWLMWPY